MFALHSLIGISTLTNEATWYGYNSHKLIL